MDLIIGIVITVCFWTGVFVGARHIYRSFKGGRSNHVG